MRTLFFVCKLGYKLDVIGEVQNAKRKVQSVGTALRL